MKHILNTLRAYRAAELADDMLGIICLIGIAYGMLAIGFILQPEVM